MSPPLSLSITAYRIFQGYTTTAPGRKLVPAAASRLGAVCRHAVSPFRILAPTFLHTTARSPRQKKVLTFEENPLKYYNCAKLPPLSVPFTNWSFYRFTDLPEADLPELRTQLLELSLRLNCRGRIYISKQGINGQFSCPDKNLAAFKERLEEWSPKMKNLPFNRAISKQVAFTGLNVKVKDLVNDGQDINVSEDSMPQAKHVTPAEWHELLTKEKETAQKESQPGPLIIDLRNHYESEVGHFKGAMIPDVDTYRDGVEVVKKALADRKKADPVYMYCTGGIRCTRTGSMLVQEGFENVVMLKGGITAYARFVRENPNVESLYHGKNFTFDARLGEPVTQEVLSHCHTCPPNGHDGKSAPEKSDKHTNCANRNCNLLMIQCPVCRSKYHGTCGSKVCVELAEKAKAANPLVGTEREDGFIVRFLLEGSRPTFHDYPARIRPKLTLPNRHTKEAIE